MHPRRSRSVEASRAGVIAAALLALLVLPLVLPGAARAAQKSFVVVQVQVRGQDPAPTADAADRVGRLVAPAADRELVTADAAVARLRRSISVPPQHETTKKLEEIYADIKRGDELLYTNPAAAIPVLVDAKRDLEQILERLAVDGTVQETLFQTQMLLARSHIDNGDRDTARTLLEEIIREYGVRDDVNEDNYHPDLVALYRETAAALEPRRTASLRVDTGDLTGLEILVSRRPVMQPDGSPALTPYVVDKLLPGDYFVQVRRSESDVSKIHRVSVPEGGEATLSIDVPFDQALALDDQSIALQFADLATLQARLNEYALRVGALVEVDEVVAVGIVEQGGIRQLVGARYRVAKRSLWRAVQLPVAGRGEADERQLNTAAQVLAGFEDAPAVTGTPIIAGVEEEPTYEPWYTNWVGWTLIGVGVVGIGVGGYYTGQWLDNQDCAGDAGCGTFEHRLSAAEDAKSERSVAYAMYGVGGAAIVAGALVFALWDRPADDTASADHDLPLLAPLTLPDGGGLTFQGRF